MSRVTVYGPSEDNPPIKKEIEEYMYSHQKVDSILWHPIVATVDDIPKSLKEWRIWRDFTLRQVEEKTGISNAYLSQLETGKVKKPSFDGVVKMCNLYVVKLII
jgi:DNA-binding Xre family transcriptional regulator